MAGLAQMMGLAAACRARRRWRSSREKMPGGLPQGMPGAAAGDAGGTAGHARRSPGPKFPRQLARSRRPKDAAALAAFPSPWKKEMSDSRHHRNNSRKETRMSLKIRLARAGTKKRPVLSHRDRRQPLAARRPLHRAARLFQSADGEGQRRTSQARPRQGQGLDGEGRAADRSRVALPRRCRR